jgi:hypothetical protein
MLTNQFDRDDRPYRAAPRIGTRALRAASWEPGRRARRVLQELLDLAERCVLGAGVMLALAMATLLLIRSLAR